MDGLRGGGDGIGDPALDRVRAWNTVRANLRDSAGARLFDQWLKPIELVAGHSAPDTVRLALPSAFMI